MTRADLYLVLTAVIWGSNYSVIKFVLQELPPRSFNAIRLVIASTAFLAMIALTRRRKGLARLTLHQWLLIILLGVVGQFGYQLLFIEGMDRTSVANASIIIAATPAAVGLASAAAGHERLPWVHWLGMALSFVGVYLIVAGGARAGVGALAGDMMMIACVVCWTIYTVAARPMLVTTSPLLVTGLSMAVGTLLFLPFSVGSLQQTDWASVRLVSWVCVVFSSLLALNFAYTAWYHGVRHLGSSRTSLYSNLVPVAALIVAMMWLGERIEGLRLVGAVLVLVGVITTRIPTRLAAPTPNA